MAWPSPVDGSRAPSTPWTVQPTGDRAPCKVRMGCGGCRGCRPCSCFPGSLHLESRGGQAQHPALPHRPQAARAVLWEGQASPAPLTHILSLPLLPPFTSPALLTLGHLVSLSLSLPLSLLFFFLFGEFPQPRDPQPLSAYICPSVHLSAAVHISLPPYLSSPSPWPDPSSSASTCVYLCPRVSGSPVPVACLPPRSPRP